MDDDGDDEDDGDEDNGTFLLWFYGIPSDLNMDPLELQVECRCSSCSKSAFASADRF